MKNFYNYQETDKFDQFQRKVEIVELLLDPPVSISRIEANYQSLGKKAARDITDTSTRWILLFCILLPFVCFIVSSHILVFINELRNSSIKESQLIKCLIYFFFPFIYLFLAVIVKYIFIKGTLFNCAKTKNIENISNIKGKFLGKDGDDKVKKFFDIFDKSELDDDEKNRRWRALSLCCSNNHHCITRFMILNVPFALRNIWLWTFAMSIYPLFLNKKYYINFDSPINNEMFSDFMADFFRAMLIGFVSYIATNIINELLQLREQYVQGKEEMSSLSETIFESNSASKKILSNISLLNATEELNNALRNLLKKITNNDNSEITDHKNFLEDSFKEFTKTISNQLKVFEDKSTEDSIINLWLINSINQYFYLSSNQFEKKSSIITKFEFFGKILNATFDPMLEEKNKDLLDKFKKKYEIYTVLVLPPSRFLNYDDGQRRNADWDKFIETMIKTKDKGLKINRHFLCLDLTKNKRDLVRKYFGEESISPNNDINDCDIQNPDLVKPNFELQLQRYLLCDSKKRPQIGDNGSYFITDSAIVKEGFEKITLAEFLDTIHYDNACKVIELKIPTSKDQVHELLATEEVFWDKESHKAIDYFAIREIESKKWLFCYRTISDKTLDFANIRIHHKLQKDNKEWKNICDNLDKIFMPNTVSNHDNPKKNSELGTTIYPIKSYGKTQ